jgi:hypothetical protein
MDQIGSKDVQLAKKQCNLVGDYLLTSVLSKEKDYLPVLMNEFLKNQNSVENMGKSRLSSLFSKLVDNLSFVFISLRVSGSLSQKSCWSVCSEEVCRTNYGVDPSLASDDC